LTLSRSSVFAAAGRHEARTQQKFGCCFFLLCSPLYFQHRTTKRAQNATDDAKIRRPSTIAIADPSPTSLISANRRRSSHRQLDWHGREKKNEKKIRTTQRKIKNKKPASQKTHDKKSEPNVYHDSKKPITF
jgi:hypothetical protein